MTRTILNRWPLVTALALVAPGCADEPLPDEGDETELMGESQSGLSGATFIPCTAAHPSTPAGNMVIHRAPNPTPGGPDIQVGSSPTACGVMGITGYDPPSDMVFELVADDNLYMAAGGTSAPVTCGVCLQTFGPGGPTPPGSRTTSFSTRITYPTVVESLGVLHGTPLYGSWPGWHRGSSAPLSSSAKSSYCFTPPYTNWDYGALTNRRGYELVPDHITGYDYGLRAYQQYDPGWNVIRSAAVVSSNGHWSGSPQLTYVPRGDACDS